MTVPFSQGWSWKHNTFLKNVFLRDLLWSKPEIIQCLYTVIARNILPDSPRIDLNVIKLKTFKKKNFVSYQEKSILTSLFLKVLVKFAVTIFSQPCWSTIICSFLGVKEIETLRTRAKVKRMRFTVPRHFPYQLKSVIYILHQRSWLGIW